MKRYVILILSPLLFVSCFHVDSTKYENIYKNGAARLTDNTAIPPLPGAAPVTVTAQSAPVIQSAATPQTTAAKAQQKQKVKELVIRSNSVTFNKDTMEALFDGDVKVWAEGVEMTSKKLKSVDYKQQAEAIDSVKAKYSKQDVTIFSDRMKYYNGMNDIESTGNVRAIKVTNDGNTVTMYSDKAVFNNLTGQITATGEGRRIKIVFRDIYAYADSAVYDDATKQMELIGRPVVKKQESFFISKTIALNVDKKIMTMKDDIWSELYYGDFDKTKQEVEGEISKNGTPGKNVQ